MLQPLFIKMFIYYFIKKLLIIIFYVNDYLFKNIDLWL
jgi:hypothetical protein